MKNIRHQRVTALACSPNGFLMASGGAEGTVEVSTSDGVPLYKYHGHEGLIRSVLFAPGGRMLASASSDTTVQVWDAITGKNSVIYTGHGEQVEVVSWSPDGVHIVSCDQHEVQVWEASTGLLKWHRRSGAAFSSVLWSPDGRYVVATDLGGVVTLWTSEGSMRPVGSSLVVSPGRRAGSSSLLGAMEARLHLFWRWWMIAWWSSHHMGDPWGRRVVLPGRPMADVLPWLDMKACTCGR